MCFAPCRVKRAAPFRPSPRGAPAIELFPLAAIAPAPVDALLDQAFGADRRDRTAYRIRGGLAPLAPLSLALCDGQALVGTIQCWPIALHLDTGGAVPLVMVGPVAIARGYQGRGHGTTLMHAMLTAAADDDAGAMMLIGDAPYYARFGFSAARTAKWRTPGPVEADRLLARGARVPDAAGMLGPRG